MKTQAIWGLAAVLAMSAIGCKSSGSGDDGGDFDSQTRHEQISQSALPQAVRDGFAKAYPGATIKEVEKETYANGTVHYEIGYRGADGKDHDVELNADGEVLEGH
jgi:uncharacterized membrane protein YkoI